MDASKLIDERVRELDDWRGEFVAQLRSLIHEADSEIKEDWKWGSPVFVHNGLICSIGSFKDHVKMHFFKGVELKDSNKVFNAGLEAKTMRGIDFTKGDKIDKKGVIDLIRRAVLFNTK